MFACNLQENIVLYSYPFQRKSLRKEVSYMSSFDLIFFLIVLLLGKDNGKNDDDRD